MLAMTDAEWIHEVVAAFESPLREAGMGEPQVSPGRYVMWHGSAADEPRPSMESPVWANSGSGCYDVTIREDSDGDETVLSVATEGTELLRVPALTTPSALAAVLKPAGQSIGDVVVQDFARFEDEFNGYLPGTEPRS